MRKLILFLLLLLIITIIFLLSVLVLGRDSGKGALQVTTVPESQVFLDNKFVGKTPLCLCELPQLLEGGDYTIKLIPLNKDLKTSQQKITIYPGILTVVDRTFDANSAASSGSLITLSPSSKGKAELMVISFPGNADVVLDSEIVGKTPLLTEDITASDHEIKILKDGYKEKILKVKTIEGKRLEANVVLGIKTTEDSEEDEKAQTESSKVIILATPVGFLRVRKENSVNSAQVATVNPGDELKLLSEVKGWYEVKLENGTTGWISAEFARKN